MATPKQKIITQEVQKSNPFTGYQRVVVTHYDPADPQQTRPDTDGTGAYGKKIEFGDVAVGRRDKGKYPAGTYVEIPELKNFDTPYGRGIFRVYDRMAERFDDPNADYIDIAIPSMYKGADAGKNRPDADTLRSKVGKQTLHYKTLKDMPRPTTMGATVQMARQAEPTSTPTNIQTEKKRGFLSSLLSKFR